MTKSIFIFTSGNILNGLLKVFPDSRNKTKLSPNPTLFTVVVEVVASVKARKEYKKGISYKEMKN